MPGFWQKTMVYLGLKDDDEEYADYDYEALAGAEERGHVPYVPEYEEPVEQARTREPVYAGARAPEAAPTQRQARVRAVPASELGGEPAVVRDVATPVIRPVPAPSSRVHVVEPKNFNDAQEVGDRLKSDQPVIINLQGIGRDLQRRLIDFSSGLTYAVGGSMSRVSDQVFLLTPSNVEVSQEEKERLQARGLYHA